MNKLSKLVNNIGKLPRFIQKYALYYTLGNAVKFAGTAGIQFEKMGKDEIILTLQNKKKVQNHIGQIHAAATALLAETATAMLVGLHLPDDKIPLLKQMKIDYVKRSQGQQKAVAILDSDSIKRIQTEEKGEILVPITVTDAVGTEVIKAEMLWAWISKSRIKS